jgi:SpoVK/Ycf46/Vps4 family AAA+-type ATPase
MTAREPLVYASFAAPEWRERNYAYVRAHAERIKLLIARRIAWLRTRWTQDPLKSYGSAVVSDQAADMLLQAEDRDAEAAFYAADPRAQEACRALAEIERDLADQQRVLEESGAWPALSVLARVFDLTPFEHDVIALCLAPELDPALEPLYAYVQDDAGRRYATPALAAGLFAAEPETAIATFTAHAPLRRLQLVACDSQSASALATRPIRLAERVIAFLLGDMRIDARVEQWLHPIASVGLLPDQEALAARLASVVAADERMRVLGLVAPARAGKRAVARALAAHLGLVACELDLARMPSASAERDDALHLLEREAGLARLAYYVDASSLDRNDRALTALSDAIVERLNTFVIVGGTSRYPTATSMPNAFVIKPDAVAQRELWRANLAGADVGEADMDHLVQQFDLGPTEIERCVRGARTDAQLEVGSDAPPTIARLWRACREEAGRSIDALGQRITPCYGWDDLVVPADVMQRLREIAAQVANRARVYESWQLGAKLARGRGISALFAGPSGVGKTMAAEVLAQHLELDLFRIDLAGVVSKYIGETEKNLKRVFDAAEVSGAILFFDEADALFGKRTEVKDSHDRYANIEINYLLQRMEDYRGLAILATNMKSHLDAAFLRRLRFIVDIPPPDAAVRREIWRRVFPSAAPTESLDFDALARMDITGGNIRNIAVNAAFLAAEAGTPIRMEHVLHAARREYDKLEKMPVASEFGPQLTRTIR